MSAIRFMDATKDFHAKVKIPERDLLPLIPPDGVLAETSKVQPHQLGKIPGRYSGGKWYGLSGSWPTFGLSENDRYAAALWPTHNVGLRAADYPAIDCDVDSVEALELVEGLITARFDPAPVRTRGNSPRALFVYRREGDDPIRKIRVEFEDDKGKPHAVEVLGLGQQYVVSGLHPSGVAYEWRKGRDLAGMTDEQLPRVSATKLSSFMADLCREIENKGWKVTRTTSPRYGRGAEGMGVVVHNSDPLVDADIAVAALQAVPNTPDNLPNREDLLRVTASFKHMLGRSADAYYATYETWACRDSEWCPPEYARQIWDSLSSVRTSPDYLLGLARKRGFRGDALVDFADYRDDENVENRIEVVQAQETEEGEALRQLADKVVYFASEQLFIVRATGELLSASALNSYPGLGTAVSPAGASGVKTAANMLINSGLMRIVSGVTFAPGQPQLVQDHREGRPGTYFNRWHAQTHVLPASVTDDDVRPWLDHVAFLVPDDAERTVLLDFLAHVVQKRGTKIRWAPLLVGRQGTGKDMMLKPIVMFLAHNACEVKPEELIGKFNKFLESELLLVEEMVRFDKASVYDHIKPIISGTATGRVTVERKHRESYEVPNTVNLFFFSNNPDAVKLEDDDRRFFVISSEAEKRDSEYYYDLAERFYREQSGWRKVIRWLLQRDCSALDINRPVHTAAKQEMIETQRSSLFVTLREQLRTGFYAKRNILTANEVMLTAKNDYNFPLDTRSRGLINNTAEIVKALRSCGWHYVEKSVRLSDDAPPVRVWVREKHMMNLTARDIRSMYEEEAAS